MTDGQLGAAESGERAGMTSEEQERTALFTSLGERLLQGEANGDDARRAHLLRLLASLMPAAGESGRKALIERVAAMPSPPRDLALRLAADDPQLSAPLLRSAPFSQQELIELVTRTGPEHHIEIAKRADLTLDVWLALARAAARRARESGAASSEGDSAGTTAESAGVERTAEAAPPPRSEADAPPASPEPAAPTADAAEENAAAGAHTETGEAAEPPGPSAAPAPEPPAAPAAGESGGTRERREPFGTAPPLEDPDPEGWRFETDRESRLVRLSPNAALAFGRAAPGLLGESFAGLLQAHAAAPAPDAVGEAMRRRIPLRDLVVETMPANGAPRQWVLRGQPRFSFPDGRFEGYVGTARDREAGSRRPPPRDPARLLDRLGEAADRLAQAASTPELAAYARVMKEYVEALKAASLERPDPTRRPGDEERPG